MLADVDDALFSLSASTKEASTVAWDAKPSVVL